MKIRDLHSTQTVLTGLLSVFVFCGMRCGGVLSTPSSTSDPTTTSAAVFVDVATTALTTCGLTDEGKVYCWGELTLGGTTAEYTAPQLLAALPRTESIGATIGAICGTAVGGGSIWCFGTNEMAVFGDSGAQSNYTTASPFTATLTTFLGSAGALGETSGSTRCAIKADQSVMCWGDNTFGAVGDHSTTPRGSPTAIGSTGMVQIATGYFHTCGVTKNGTVECWGRGNGGQLGNSTIVDSLGAVEVIGLGGSAAEVFPGESATCARLVAGAVKCWGNNANGVIGDNHACGFSTCTTAQAVVGISTATQLHVVGQTAVVILSDGTLSCWGTNGSGQFGDSTTNSSAVPIACGSGLTGVTKVRLGNANGVITACAVLDTGKIACWGDNAKSQTGLSSATATSVLTPDTQVSVP